MQQSVENDQSQRGLKDITMLQQPEQLDSEQRDRLWEHGLHAENNFFNQMNIFLVFESLLLIIVGILYNNRLSEKFILIIAIIFGFLLSLLWLYVQTNRAYTFYIIRERIIVALPEYRETRRQLKNSLPKWRTPNLKLLVLLAYAITSLIAAMWITLFVYILLSR